MSDDVYGRCQKCGGNLTSDHNCPWSTLDEVLAELREESGPSFDDELAKAKKWVKRKLRKAVVTARVVEE